MTIADLIGEIDMIKHAEGRYLSSELTMHFGLIPRTNRGIFCINELPDLSPKIQVGLFNVLEERDVQIRGYPIRLDLDLCMVFSANPEDYTNRGRIVTPLKDRIGSVVRTHYPLTRELGIAISDQNAWLDRDGAPAGDPVLHQGDRRGDRRGWRGPSSHVNQQSGVSVRMSIANLENVVSNAERRALINGERWIVPRVSDLAHVAASSRGKLELTMAEDDGQEDKLIGRIVAEAVKNVFGQLPRRPTSSARRSSTSSRARGSRSATPSRSASVLDADREGPRPAEAGRRAGPRDPARPATTPRPARPPPPARPSSSSKGCTSTTS